MVIKLKKIKSKNSFLVQMPTNSISHLINLLVQHIKYINLQKNKYDGIIHNNRNASICSRIAIFFK